MRHVTTWLVLFCTSLGCGESEPLIPPSTGSTERYEQGSEEVFYLYDVEGISTLTAAQPFDHFEFHFTLGDIEIRTLDAAGIPLGPWTRASEFLDDTHPSAFEGAVSLERPASSIQVRATGALEFGRILVGPGALHQHDGDEPLPEGAMVALNAVAGRWIPPADALALGNEQYLPYSGAPTSCSGSLRAGTREFGDFLKREFVGATSYGGYACRPNTANTSQYSVHASGRAIDLFVPLAGGEADNDLGDPIANYLISHAQEIGIEFIVWDRTSWGAHRAAPKHRAYTGPHPHHDHLHIELSPTASNATGRTFPSVILDTPPVGFLDAVDCESIRGWAQDPDAPDQPIEVYVSIGGPVFAEGAAGYFVTANEKRDDLCEAIGSCEHGFTLNVPRGLMDGTAREVHVYGMDVTGPDNAALGAAPKMLQCDRPDPTLAPDYGVRRHVPSAAVLEAWLFDRNDIVIYDDAIIDAFPLSDPLPASPRLAVAPDSGAVYLIEPGVRRHVPNPAAMTAWHFDWAAIESLETLEDLIVGAPLQARPFLAKGAGPEVYLIVPPPPLWADSLSWDAPPRLGRNQTAVAALTLRNRGSMTWTPALFELRGCDAVLDADVDSTKFTTLNCEITGPDTVGVTEECFELFHDGFAFEERTCVSYEVVEEAVTLDPTQTDGDGKSGGARVIHGRGGCSSVEASPTLWTLLLGFVLVAPRRRR